MQFRELDLFEILKAISKVLNKPCMYISIIDSGDNWDEVIKAAPYLNKDEHTQLLLNGYGYLVFNSEEEMQEAYNQTVGDEGPTKFNKYNGSVRVYALTSTGNENT